MISSDIIRGYNDTILLHILCLQDSYGYQISKSVADISGGKYTIRETTLYSAINRLEKNGYITSYSGSETQGRPRTYYTITAAGRAYYEEKCSEWKLTKEVINQFTTKGKNDE